MEQLIKIMKMKKMENNKFLFPIITFKEGNNFLYFFDKEKDFSTTTELLLKKEIFKGFIIVDSDGFIYKIKHVKKVGNIGFFGINPLLKDWWKDREIRVEFEFEPNLEKIHLDTLKEIVIEKVEKAKQFWRESWSIKELRDAINNAKTFQELICLFR